MDHEIQDTPAQHTASAVPSTAKDAVETVASEACTKTSERKNSRYIDNSDQKGTQPSPSLTSYIRVFRYNDKLGWVFNLVAFVAMIGAGLALPLMDVVFGGFVNIFNDFVTGKLSSDDYLDEVGRYTLYFVYIFIGKFCLTYTWTVLINISAIRVTRNLRVDFVRQILRQEVSFFDDSSLSISSQISVNGNLVNHGISEKLGLIIQALSMFVSAFVVAFIVQWKLTLITLAIVPVNTVVTLACIYFDARYEYDMFDIYTESGSLAEEVFSTIRTAHAFWAFPKLSARFDSILERARRIGLKKSKLYAVLFPVEFFSVTAGYGLAFWQGIRMYSNGEIQNPGTVVTVIFAVLVAAQALTQIAPQTLAISKAIAAAQDLFSIIDKESAVDPLSGTGKDIPNFQGNIQMRGIQFSYPTRPTIPVLQGFDLEIPSGKTIALVGASGSGKSTIFGLLERWYESSAGEIRLDGHQLRDINLRWLRTNIRLVQQEPILFSGTVYQNVVDGLCGTKDETLPDDEKEQLVRKACKAAFAHDFIQDLPSAYQTWIGERGASLSGGQKQRIVIARSIISDPKVLLLDEATSALDPEAERVVQAALRNIAKGRTTVVIAHRLSTVKDADRIVVMSKGNITESGSHHELMRREGAYFRLVQAQDLGRRHDSFEPDEKLSSDGSVREIVKEPTVDRSGGDVIQTSERHREVCGFFGGLYLIMKDQRALRWHGLVSLLCCLGGGVTYPILAVLLSKTLQTFETIDVQAGNFFSLMFFVVALGNLVLYAIIGWLSNIVAQTVMKFYRSEIFNNALRQDMAFFDQPENGTGALVSRLASEPSSLQELLSVNISLMIISSVNVVSSCILAIAYGWKLGLVLTFGGLPFIVGSGYARIRLESKFEEDTVGRFAESSAVAAEAVMGIRTISSFSMEEKTIHVYGDKLRGLAREAIGNLSYKMMFYSLSQSISLLAMGLGFWYGGKLMATGEYTSSQFYIVYLSIVFSGEAAAILFQYSTSVTKAGTAINYILRLRRDLTLFDGDTQDDGESTPINASELATSEKATGIVFDKVEFSYPLRPNKKVLREISTDVKPGTKVAFVGASGCGKSTMMALLERFYDPTSGSVRANNQDIRTVGHQEHRKDIALVQQEPVLYQGSIRDNISLGIETNEPEESQICQACKSANIWDFISSLPEGLNTRCGNQGLSLSGGQKQRVAIARALIRKPKLLLLDEATSALDSESEKVVKEALDNAAAGRTTIAVAHRLSTIRDADIIFVFDNGKIAEAGTHNDLLSKQGLYHAMVLGQSLDKEAL